MPKTRQLNEGEREVARAILDEAREALLEKSGGDPELLWAMRRYVYIRLQYDERGSPMQRKVLKQKKRVAQEGRCAACGKELPERGAELDRLEPMKGYTEENTRLLCHECHRAEQQGKRFT